ncbi:hypothetical protein [uncultured Bifidobacterium sp.]|uniref:hypothetical protein n=1 Tax=uncultured Bifidobacterium sp. TaxID=165187 RepID=UPI002582AE4E|nr:hypothetical protein [uncultured Bifidobacterium sp.]MEE0653744.1 hypothetical protein [Bifidobacterium criceti]
MNTPLDMLANPLKTLQSLIPASSRREDELNERIDAIGIELERVEQESHWRAIDDERRINELTKRLDDELARHPRRSPALMRADTVTALVMLVLSAGMLIPVMLTLFGVIDPTHAVIRWVTLGLIALAFGVAIAFAILRERFPKTFAMTIVFICAVMMQLCACLL